MKTIYLDHAATSWPKPPEVLAAWNDYHQSVPGSPGRGAHRGSLEATKRVENVRRELCQLLGGSDPRRLIFTSSCTHALNLGVFGFLKKGEHAIATGLDHNSVLRPLAAMEARGIIELTIVAGGREGFVKTEDVRAAIRSNTKLIAIPHASNVIGTIQDVDAIVTLAHAAGIVVLLDAAQTAGIVPIDAKRSEMDMIAVPSHKSLLGPSGCGALLVRENVQLEPCYFGGTGVESEKLTTGVSWPMSFEPGTANPAGIVAWGAGIQYVGDFGPERILQNERELAARLIEGFVAIPGVHLYGTTNIQKRVATIAISIDGVEAHEAAAILDTSFGILVRAGLICAARLRESIGGPADGFIRFSLGYNTTKDDVDAAIHAVSEIAASVNG
ncbi:MAG: aminotransferase class V-fold PLP-dependent enzyme [Planctomycetota bacterium]